MSSRLLLIEPSATMRYVLEKHAESLGFTVDSKDSYVDGQHALNTQYQQFGNDYSGVLFGWPSAPDQTAAELATLLEQAEFTDLPVLVMSTDMRAETRAWVAGRANTAVLAWKEYQGLEAYLQRLIDTTPDDNDTFSTKFDNNDIRLLIVDDSSTIRLSLRDLFQMQGYQVSLAATHEEALSQVRSSRIDIAILDFYLTETTGDLVCRDIMSDTSTGDVICAVLTGTYSDHIIKRSLRAGAVECMFKNESSELLLSRIDAISRFVRQKRELKGDRKLLGSIVDSVVGALVVIDAQHRLSFFSQAALQELGLETGDAMVGQPSETLLPVEGLAAPGTGLHTTNWRLPDGGVVSVNYEHLTTDSEGRCYIRFKRKTITSEQTRLAVIQRARPALQTVPRIITENAKPLVTTLESYLETAEQQSFRVSLLLLDVFIKQPDGEVLPLPVASELGTLVEQSLLAIYRRDGHVARFENNRFAFLLRHQEATQAYLLVRKIMQICLEIDHHHAATLKCSGSLLSLDDNASQPSDALLDHAIKGVELVSRRGYNQTLLMDLRRMLSAYPAGQTK